MKTIELTNSELTTLLTALRIVNWERKQWVKDPMFRGDIKSRIRLARKLIKMHNVRGEIY
jgi:hypothetical protein